MSLYLTTSGRRVSVEFPSELAAWPEFAKVVENARRLERELQEAARPTSQPKPHWTSRLRRIALDSQKRS